MDTVDQEPCRIAGGEFRDQPLDLERRLDRQAAQPVALDRKLRREWMGLHAGAPDDGRRGNPLTRRQRNALGIDRRDRHAAARFDAEDAERFFDDGQRARAHVGADPHRMVGENDLRRHYAGGAQLGRHLGRGLDPGQPAADHEHGGQARRGIALYKAGNMDIEPLGRCIGIDVKSVAAKAGDRRVGEPAAERKDQTIVGHGRRHAACFVGDGASTDVEPGDLAFDAAHANGPEHAVERNTRVAEIGLVIAHTNRMPGRSLYQDDFDPPGANAQLIERPRGADRAPKTGEAAAKHHDAVSHRTGPRQPRCRFASAYAASNADSSAALRPRHERTTCSAHTT